MSRTQDELLSELRLTSQLVALHPWFKRGSRSPVADHHIPRAKDEFDCLLNNLSIVAEIVCLHPDHADARRDAYDGMMAEVVGAFNSALAEPALMKYLGTSDRRAIERELARLRRLVIDSATVGASYERQNA